MEMRRFARMRKFVVFKDSMLAVVNQAQATGNREMGYDPKMSQTDPACSPLLQTAGILANQSTNRYMR